MVEYEEILETVAANPGIEVDSLRNTVSEDGDDPDRAEKFLREAVDSGDVIEADSKHWIVRKGKYSYQNYDHEP